MPNRTARIARLNDTFRQEALDATGASTVSGRVITTRGVATLPPHVQAQVLREVQTFNTFTLANDPHQEHNFGSLEVGGNRLFWKIDYYGNDPLEGPERGCEHPEDPAASFRVLTIMLTSEY